LALPDHVHWAVPPRLAPSAGERGKRTDFGGGGGVRVLGFWRVWRTPLRRCLLGGLRGCWEGEIWMRCAEEGKTDSPSSSNVFTLYSGEFGSSCWSASVTCEGVESWSVGIRGDVCAYRYFVFGGDEIGLGVCVWVCVRASVWASACAYRHWVVGDRARRGLCLCRRTALGRAGWALCVDGEPRAYWGRKNHQGPSPSLRARCVIISNVI
jgi:hypothetical protein